ncbi:unnamed protein product [Rotaria sp. Silwood2]|nr:unnamed protein product [Rotaria sp. Silwood2]CAF2744975.1 unnamed protein product [Rotaria sp. Silwood2]CAF3031097.1 unnamed protein product [Rotaria sp. Silwood2]CAF3201774.1 unnamed protein product [Rotaria sp. Silwood2]CAF4095190.1 unnamed protein product [Rotaria sp. Silwood2]
MHINRWNILFVFLLLSFATIQFVNAGRHGHGHGHHGHGNGHHGHGHGGSNYTQCHQANQFFNQWWPQSAVANAFQTLCYRVGATQAWTTLQGLLGVAVTGTLDQATFQALLSNSNQALLAQQLLAGVTTP